MEGGYSKKRLYLDGNSDSRHSKRERRAERRKEKEEPEQTKDDSVDTDTNVTSNIQEEDGRGVRMERHKEHKGKKEETVGEKEEADNHNSNDNVEDEDGQNADDQSEVDNNDDDPRIGSLLIYPYPKSNVQPNFIEEKPKIPDITILGFSNDEGCIANGGRYGARDGPEEIFKLLPKVGTRYNPELNIDLSLLQISMEKKNIVKSHDDLRSMVAKVSSKNNQPTKNNYSIGEYGSIPIIVGGSNDQSFPNALGLLENYPDLDVINIDAHLDVRPGKGHSGAPFQELLNNEAFQGSFYEFAAQGNQCSAKHANFVLSKGGEIIWLSSVQKDTFQTILNKKTTPLFVSFDIDSINASEAPGVSCPSTRGLSAVQACQMCFQSGQSLRVVGMDISEFNPRIENNITPRLVTQMIYHFLLGFATRKKQNQNQTEED